MAGTWHVPDRIKAEHPPHHLGPPQSLGSGSAGPGHSLQGGPMGGVAHSGPLLTPCIPLHKAHLCGVTRSTWASRELWTIAPTPSCTPGDRRGQWGGLLARTHTDSLGGDSHLLILLITARGHQRGFLGGTHIPGTRGGGANCKIGAGETLVRGEEPSNSGGHAKASASNLGQNLSTCCLPRGVSAAKKLSSLWLLIPPCVALDTLGLHSLSQGLRARHPGQSPQLPPRQPRVGEARGRLPGVPVAQTDVEAAPSLQGWLKGLPPILGWATPLTALPSELLRLTGSLWALAQAALGIAGSYVHRGAAPGPQLRAVNKAKAEATQGDTARHSVATTCPAPSPAEGLEVGKLGPAFLLQSRGAGGPGCPNTRAHVHRHSRGSSSRARRLIKHRPCGTYQRRRVSGPQSPQPRCSQTAMCVAEGHQGPWSVGHGEPSGPHTPEQTSQQVADS